MNTFRQKCKKTGGAVSYPVAADQQLPDKKIIQGAHQHPFIDLKLHKFVHVFEMPRFFPQKGQQVNLV